MPTSAPTICILFLSMAVAIHNAFGNPVLLAVAEVEQFVPCCYSSIAQDQPQSYRGLGKATVIFERHGLKPRRRRSTLVMASRGVMWRQMRPRSTRRTWEQMRQIQPHLRSGSNGAASSNEVVPKLSSFIVCHRLCQLQGRQVRVQFERSNGNHWLRSGSKTSSWSYTQMLPKAIA